MLTNDFTILKSSFNYSNGNYYVITKIECEKILPTLISKENAFLNTKNIEQMTIEFYEYDDLKKLTITDKYISVNNQFIQFYYAWRGLGWTYVKFGEPKTKLRFGEPVNGYEIGEVKETNTDVNKLKILPYDLITLRLNEGVGVKNFGIRQEYHYKDKIMYFQNYNPKFGTLREYYCEINGPWTKSDFHLSFVDTAYSLYLQVQEFYPKYTTKLGYTDATKKAIPLIKSGKIYYINILLGAKKKKYVLDSGASDFTIDESSYKQLLESGIIKTKHKLSGGEYQIADGSIKKYKRTIIPEILIDNITIENVVAIVVPDGQPLLLGKSLLDNFKTWKIDNSKSVLIVEIN